uniref:Uncharacterized protein n=1 Tax=Rhodosorus marinus TaxID=101924 RepID=A0A7S3A1N5_9RHOD|mmetsp:Transcript_3893/g.16698  ORF Transcript_3893/g.16698 Transcript_3893/m.16698 type:complete len:310 (+) Transcript_3893:519-1448(+)|eukprot:CAMPEP_0113966352 /NCGR_PEP_ID=MMETSP0011_2-20120614/8284_1 /TAXON_ID=101924 /ORGANISM="Rhodosorus marinus" /LENGTH=309 /DNA_ID=CAMNT_0000979029 /DNA_START=469 /DNA_END=1398 /DNA_ORIENTATION=- /assembly_acc=CAM_ASM_000156
MKKDAVGGRGVSGPSKISPRPEMNGEVMREVNVSPNTLPAGVSPSSSPPNGVKKSRKPYTITKNRENWSQDEHERFLEALRLYERDWKQIESHIGTKNVIQIRSHAQKYFLKVQKNNTGEHVPPPRKRRNNRNGFKAEDRSRAGNPPAPRIAMQMPTQVMPAGMMGMQQQVFADGYVGSPNLSMMGANGDMNRKPPSSMDSVGQNKNISDGVKSYNAQTQSELSPEQNAQTGDRGSVNTMLEKPRMNFARIYEFFSRLFDPAQSTSELEKIVEQTFNVLDCEIIKLLAQNLEMNLNDTEFRKMLLETYR